MVHGWLAIVDETSVGQGSKTIAAPMRPQGTVGDRRSERPALSAPEPHLRTITLADAQIRTAQWGDGAPDVVLLHDGLGSVAQWRSVPERIAERSGRTILAYDRPGHGESTPVPSGPRPADWMHTEADRLERLLDALDAQRPLLVGHSDGGTIALLHAIEHNRAARVLVLAAHSWVEPAAVEQIGELRDNAAAVIAGLSRHHRHAAEVFEAWSAAWTGDEFGTFDLRPRLDRIAVPVHVVQGTADEFATDAQALETAAAIGPNGRCLLLPDARHLLHHDDPDLVVDLVLAELAAMG